MPLGPPGAAALMLGDRALLLGQGGDPLGQGTLSGPTALELSGGRAPLAAASQPAESGELLLGGFPLVAGVAELAGRLGQLAGGVTVRNPALPQPLLGELLLQL